MGFYSILHNISSHITKQDYNIHQTSLGGATIKFFTSSVNLATLPGVSSKVVKTVCILSFHDIFMSSAVGS